MKEDELNIIDYSYRINEKLFYLQADFTYEELEWIDKVYNSLSPTLPKGKGEEKRNEISGSFTRDEIEKTLSILLKDKNGNPFNHEDFLKTRESLSVKIIADFFLWKAALGHIMQLSLVN